MPNDVKSKLKIRSTKGLTKKNSSRAVATSQAPLNKVFLKPLDNPYSRPEIINDKTMDWVNKKFWWGTVNEYNDEIATNGLNHGTLYFVRPE